MMPRTKAAEPLLRVPAATHLKQQQQQPPPPLQLRYSLAAPAVRTNPQDVAVLRAVVTLATSSPGHPSDHSSEASLLNVLRALHAVTSADYEARTRADAVRTLLVSLFRQFPKLEWMERLDKVEKFPNTDVSSVSLPTGMFEDPSTSFLPAGPTLVEPSSILSASHGLYSSRPGPMIPPVPSSLAIPKFQSSFRGRDFVTASRVFDAWRRITAESRNSRKRIVKTWLTSAEYWQKRLIERCFIAWHEAYRSRKISHERLLCRIAFEAFQQNAQSIRESINRFQSGVGLRKWFICWKAKASLHRTRKRRLDVAEELFGRSMRKNTQLHAFQLWRKKILERTDVQDLSDVAWKLSRSQVLKKHFELWRNRCLHACTLASLQRERQLVTLKTILLKWNAETKRRAQVFDMINHAGKDFGTRLKTRIFNAWRQTAKSRRLQKRLLLMEESKGIIVQQFIFSTWQIRWLSAREARRFVLRKYFSTWLVRTAKQKQSREFSQRLASIRQRHLVQTALRIWLQRWQRLQRLSDWSKAASARIQSAVFKLWTRNYQARRSSSFDRRRLLEQAFSLWTAAYMDRSQWVQAATAYSGARIVVNTLKIWVAERRRRQLIFAAAEILHSGNLQRRVIAIWKEQLDLTNGQSHLAVQLYQHLTLSSSWIVWRSRLIERRTLNQQLIVSAFEQQWVRSQQAQWFQRWRFALRRQNLMLMMKRFVHQSGQELTRRFFSDWRRRTVALHQQAQHAQEYWTKRIVGTSFNFWHLSLRLKTISSEVYRNTLQHRAFSFWRRRYFEAKRKKEAVELVFLEFRRRHLEHLFKKWKNYTKLRRFCRSKCQQYLRFRLLTWREATKNTFADKLFRSNLLISAWATWRSSLIFSLQGKLADLLYCKRLKSRVLRLWWYRAEGLDLTSGDSLDQIGGSQNLVSAAHSSRSATRANPTRRMSIAKAISTKRITREGFFRWRDFAARKVLLASLAAHHHNRYLQIIWFRRWKEQASMQLRARRVSDAANKSLLRAFFDSWRKRANSNIRKRNEEAEIHRVKTILNQAWSIWARARLKRQQAERTALVSYKRSAFREWRRATWTRIDERVSLRVAYQHRRAIVLRTAFSALQAAVVLRRTLVTTAAIQFLTSRQRRWWRAWRGALEQKRALACAATVADDHHRLNLTFTAFKCWVSKRRDRGLTQRAETFRRRRLCFWAFERWRNVWRLSISAERTARLSVTIAMILQKALVLRIFQAWKSHIQAIHILNGQQEELMLQFQQQKWPTISRSSMSTVILHGSFTTWRLEHRFRRHNERKAGTILVRTWLAWRSRIGVIEHMKRKGLEAAQRNQVDLLLRVWSHWSSRVMARRDNRRVLVMKRRVLLFWHCWAADQAALRTDADRFRAKSLLNRWRRAVWSSSDEAREGTADDFYRRQLLSRTYFRWCRMAALHLGRGLAASDFTLFRTISPRPAAAEIVMANRSILNRLSQARPKGGSDGGTPSARSSRSNSSAILRITADRLLQLSEEAENFRFRTQTARAFSLWRHAYMTARFERERKLVFADTWAERRLKRRVLWSWKFASPTYTARRIGGLVGSA